MMDLSGDTERPSWRGFENSFTFKKSERNFIQIRKMKPGARERLKDRLSVSAMSLKVTEVCANAYSELIEDCIKYTPNDGNSSVAIRVSDTMISQEATLAHLRLHINVE